MPKAKRRKGTAHKSATRIYSESPRRDTSVTASTTTDEQTEQTGRAARSTKRIEQRSRASGTASSNSASSYQSLIMPGMVTLGCLGLAISFSFFTTEPNRFLYGGIAALMAVMWAYSFWMRLRKVSGKEK